MVVRELELDLDAFEGPFDLLLTLVLREELDLAEIDIAGIIVAFIELLAERDELDLEACGEFLVLVAALLELKARALFPDEDAELSELGPEEAAEELARRLAEYRRMKEAAAWLVGRLDDTRDRFFRVGPAPLAPQPERKLAPQDPAQLADGAARARRRAGPGVAVAHGAPLSARVARSSSASARCCSAGGSSTSTRKWQGSSRVEVAVAFLALLELRKQGEIAIQPSRPVRADKDRARRRRKEPLMDRPLRLIAANPLDQLARTLGVAARRRVGAALDRELSRGRGRVDRARRDRARRCSRSATARAAAASSWRRSPAAGRSVRRASAAEACARLFERPVQRGLSQAALETVAIVAYLGPVSRPEVARIRGVAADSAVAGLLERGLIAEAGRDDGAGGAVRYRTTPLFERVFGLESLSQLPRLDDLGDDAEQIRERLASVAEQRTA